MTRDPRPPWPSAPAVFLDLDGTLIEIAQRPDEVRRSARLDALLSRLPAAAGGAFAIVSGRTVADVDSLLAPHRFAVAGTHGLERRRADGTVSRAPAAPDWMRGARDAMERFAAAHPGLLLENKGASMALHYRGRPDLEDAVRRFVAELPLPAGAERLRGRKVMEIKPRWMNKGAAIRAFMSERRFAGRTPVFAGDDVTDESGFAVVNELGGVSVKVGTREAEVGGPPISLEAERIVKVGGRSMKAGGGATAARWTLPDVSAVLEWLAEAVAAEKAPGGAHSSGAPSAGPHSTGPHSTGAHSTGAHSTGAHSREAQSAGEAST